MRILRRPKAWDIHGNCGRRKRRFVFLVNTIRKQFLVQDIGMKKNNYVRKYAYLILIHRKRTTTKLNVIALCEKQRIIMMKSSDPVTWSEIGKGPRTRQWYENCIKKVFVLYLCCAIMFRAICVRPRSRSLFINVWKKKLSSGWAEIFQRYFWTLI